MWLKLTKNLLNHVLVKQELALDSNLKKTPYLLIHWSNLSLDGKKLLQENQKGVCEEADDIGNEFPCGEVMYVLRKSCLVTHHHSQF